MYLYINNVLCFLQESKPGSPIDVNPGVILWTTVTFLCLLLLLKKFAWKPILESLDQRENFIKNSLEKADEAQAESGRILDGNKALIQSAEDESRRIIEEGRLYAEKIKAQIIEQSRKEAEGIKESAKSEIERKTKEAFTELKKEVADIAIAAAEKMIKESLDSNKQTKIVDDIIEGMGKN